MQSGDRMDASEVHERWFISGLPKEEGLHKLKHQRPFLFALHGPQDPVQCHGDQMTEVMGSVVPAYHSNIHLICDVSELSGSSADTFLTSTEQEKAFDPVPVTRFSCFGFCPGFTAKVQVPYSTCGGHLWRSERVVREVCPLSAMLDSLLIKSHLPNCLTLLGS